MVSDKEEFIGSILGDPTCATGLGIRSSEAPAVRKIKLWAESLPVLCFQLLRYYGNGFEASKRMTIPSEVS